MEYLIENEITKIDRVGWSQFVTNHPYANIFQSSEMYDLYISSSEHEPIILAVKDESNRIKGILLAVKTIEKRGVFSHLTARTIIYGGPLVDERNSDPTKIIEILLEALITAIRKSTIYIEVRNLFEATLYKESFLKFGFVFKDHLNLHIEKSLGELPKKLLNKSKIRQVESSIKAGAYITEATSEKEIIEFYNILKLTYKERARKPLPDLDFFVSFQVSSLNNKLGKIFLVKYEDGIIGGMVCPLTKDKILHEWYVCGLDKKYSHIHPSVLVTYHAIQYAASHNIPTFDFMGLGQPEKPYGVRDFKLQFGGEVVNYGRYFRVNNQFLYSIANLGYKFMAFLKWV